MGAGREEWSLEKLLLADDLNRVAVDRDEAAGALVEAVLAGHDPGLAREGLATDNAVVLDHWGRLSIMPARMRRGLVMEDLFAWSK